jgi:hypothetical protein
VSYLSPGSGAEAAQLTPGQPLALQVDPAITEVRLTRPDGTQISSTRGDQITIQNGQAVYADTDALGVYVVEEFKDGELQARHRYAVNLFAANESRVEPEEELAITQASGLQAAATDDRVGRQEFWRWLAALALIVLIIEWLVYQRNGIAYLRDRWRNRGQRRGSLGTR